MTGSSREMVDGAFANRKPRDTPAAFPAPDRIVRSTWALARTAPDPMTERDDAARGGPRKWARRLLLGILEPRPSRLFGRLPQHFLRRSERFGVPEPSSWLTTIAESSEDAVTSGDLEGRITGWNSGATKLYDYSADEAIGRPVAEVMKPSDPEVVAHNIGRLRRGEKLAPFEAVHHARDGRPLRVSVSLSPIKGSAGGTIGVLAISRDVTARMEAEQALKESEARFRSVVESVGEGLLITDVDDTVTYANSRVEELTGYAVEELLGRPAYELLLPPERWPGMLEHNQRRVEGAAERYETPLLRKDGTRLWAEVSASPYRDAADEIVGTLGVITDVTGRKEAEDALRESERHLRAVVHGSPVITFALDPKGVFTFENGCALRTAGLESGRNNVGYSVFEAYAGYPEILGNVERALSGEEVVATVEIGGRSYHTTYSPQRGEDGGVEGVIGVATDITERRRLERDLEHRAFHDPLTDLPNRALFVDRLSQALKRAERKRGEVAVLFLDLDGFKAVNDAFGHEAGDGVLVEVAGRLEGCLRPQDTVARLGGDEFAVLLEDGGFESAAAVTERIAEALRAPIAVGENGREASVAASVGIARGAAGDEGEPAKLLREADRAMYESKRRGKEGAGR